MGNMEDVPIPYAQHWITPEDLRAVADVLEGGWLTQGPMVEAFEQSVAQFVGTKYAVAFNSGTSALHGAMFAAGVGPGDTVVSSPITFVASTNAALYMGAKAAFVDMDPATWCIDIERLKKLPFSPKVVVPVDYAGFPVDARAINHWAKSLDCIVIEDAAHALGAKRNKTWVGHGADMTMFSFHPAKHATTGEGGVIATDCPEMDHRLRLFRSHGITKDPNQMTRSDGPWYYEMHTLGYNYRITDFQCALGLSQMKRIESNLLRRREIARAYDQAFESFSWIQTPPKPREPDTTHAYHLYPILLDPSVDRKQVYMKLRQKQILTQIHYIPVHLQPYYRARFGFQEGDFPIAEDFYRREISLPMYPKMTDAQVQRVIHEVSNAVS